MILNNVKRGVKKLSKGISSAFNVWLDYCEYVIDNYLRKQENLVKKITIACVFIGIFYFLASVIVSLRMLVKHYQENYSIQNDIEFRLLQEKVYLQSKEEDVGSFIPPTGRSVLYSAYFDSRLDVMQAMVYFKIREKFTPQMFALVRILAILPSSWHEATLQCHFKYRNNKVRIFKTTHVTTIQYNDNHDYAAFFVICDVEYFENVEYVLPKFVAISETVSSPLIGNAYIKVTYPRGRIYGHRQMEYIDKKHEVAICVGPVNNLDDTDNMHLNEFFEYYQKFGINHIFMYDRKQYAVSRSIGYTLREWKVKGFLTLIPWNISGYDLGDVYLRGSVLAWNDCLYRTSFYHHYRYTMILDVNEFLIPRVEFRYPKFIAHLLREFYEHPIFSFSLEDYYTQRNDHRKWSLTNRYCLAEEVHPFDYKPKRFLFQGVDTLFVTDKYIEGTELSPGDSHLEVPKNIALIKRFKMCHHNQDYCQCDFEYPQREEERLKEEKKYGKPVPPTKKREIIKNKKPPPIDEL